MYTFCLLLKLLMVVLDVWDKSVIVALSGSEVEITEFVLQRWNLVYRVPAVKSVTNINTFF